MSSEPAGVPVRPDVGSATVSVIVPNYNYGRFLPEALDSVLDQSVSADEILVIDDASTDDSREVIERYADRVRVELNPENLGIVENFRKAMSLTTGDLVAFVGADNRVRSDFVARCTAALAADPTAAVAYTDAMIFGPRAHELARKVGAEPTADDAYLWRFPDPTPEQLASIEESNFIHGSSMYRRTDYEAAGGYRSGAGPEDHDLFTRMIRSGRGAVRIPHPVLEYRQHSVSQANTRLAAKLEREHHEREAARLRRELEEAHCRNQRLEEHVAELTVRAAGDVAPPCADEIDWLRERARTLQAIEDGGWWRLRGRLLPLLRLRSRLMGRRS